MQPIEKRNRFYLLRSTGIFLFAIIVSVSLNAQAGRAGGGGARKPAANRSGGGAVGNRPATTGQKSGVGNNNAGGNRGGTINNNSGNRTNVGSNNKVNIDNSKRNVNINVDNSKDIRINNSRNTAVRRAPNYRPYPGPPYRYGGYRYHCYRPYVYHPYRPFYWGPVWHPWGFFVATLAVTAVIIVVDADVPPANPAWVPYYAFEEQPGSQRSGPWFDTGTPIDDYYYAGTEYYYDQGVFYIKNEEGYTVVAAPVGATIKTMPDKYETVSIDDKTKNYYYGGAFYEKTDKGYTVVPPTAGAVVEHLPEGGEEVKMGEITYVKIGETYYQPVKENGKDAYEVVDVEEDK